MNFGTTITESGVRFRLWAPGATSVEVAHCQSESDAKQMLPMRSLSNGWFQLETAKAKAGHLYQFVIDGGLSVPDPASRFQPSDVHGVSEIIDPKQFIWDDLDWTGKPWETAIIYELNVGAFSRSGTFRGVEDKLDELVDLGITAIELMPVADFPGRFGWGYDGVLHFAPDSSYGRPDDLKSLVQTAHKKGLMILLDVVYNHFGPEGNYLHAYAKKFFTDKHKTPWGDAINYDDEDSSQVRKFFIENALYWLNEYHFDGLRLDAVHAIKDESPEHFLKELARSVANGPGGDRRVHLILENDDNQVEFLQRNDDQSPKFYTAQWDDDFHHALHVLATAETGGYYADYTEAASTYPAIEHLGRCLTEGFTYQGQASRLRGGGKRGEPSGLLPSTAFVSFIQNHDQIGNRAFGERIASLTSTSALKAISAIYLLAPLIPMLYMGEEWGSKTPFFYFCDLGDELAPLVTEGRRKEFAKFPEFSTAETRALIPDPCDWQTFEKSKLDWQSKDLEFHKEILMHYRKLISIRKTEVIPLLSSWTASAFGSDQKAAIAAFWDFRKEGSLNLIANLSDQEVSSKFLLDTKWESRFDAIANAECGSQSTKIIYSSVDDFGAKYFSIENKLSPWTVIWSKL
jgi:malto-oligosyltrehalose trehalohydrolase